MAGTATSLRSVALYGERNKLKLPISSLNQEFMVFRARELLQYQESSDLKVAQAGIEVRTGRKWRECRGSEHHKVKATAKGAGAEHRAMTTCRGKIGGC